MEKRSFYDYKCKPGLVIPAEFELPLMGENFELAKAYVPYQILCKIYEPMKAQMRGTIFPELYRPYEPQKRGRD